MEEIENREEGRRQKEEGIDLMISTNEVPPNHSGAAYIPIFPIPSSSVRESTQTNIINLPSQFLCKPKIAELLFALLQIVPVKIPTGRHYSGYYQFVNCRPKAGASCNF